MKNSLFALSIISGLFLSSCGVHSASMGNLNSNVTHVQLDEANFEIVQAVRGTSTATYFFGIGGISNKSLVEKAKAEMVEEANIMGKSRALINLTTESHVTIVYPIFYRRTVTVSGHVVEFE